MISLLKRIWTSIVGPALPKTLFWPLSRAPGTRFVVLDEVLLCASEPVAPGTSILLSIDPEGRTWAIPSTSFRGNRAPSQDVLAADGLSLERGWIAKNAELNRLLEAAEGVRDDALLEIDDAITLMTEAGIEPAPEDVTHGRLLAQVELMRQTLVCKTADE